MRLKQALIFVKDVPRMTAFYCAGFGFEVRAATAGDEWVELDAGGASIALHAIPAELTRDIHVSTPPEPRTQTPLKLVFEVDDVESRRRHVTAHGAVMDEPRPWGGCDGLDPEGNVFQLVPAPRTS